MLPTGVGHQTESQGFVDTHCRALISKQLTPSKQYQKHENKVMSEAHRTVGIAMPTGGNNQHHHDHQT